MIRAALFVDAGHIQYFLYDKGWWINYKKLIEYFSLKGYFLAGLFYYEGMITELSYFEKHPGASLEEFNEKKSAKKRYFGELRNFGYTVRTKPVHRLFDFHSKTYKFKCNFDVELAIDVVDSVFTKEIDTFIIGSGDGDHTRLVKYLKGKGKKVIVMGFQPTLNKNMLGAANEIIFLEVIREKIEDIYKKGSP